MPAIAVFDTNILFFPSFPSSAWERTSRSSASRYDRLMSRSRYRIFESEYPYFMTCTIVGWAPVFTRP
jgi:hypothetical protein